MRLQAELPPNAADGHADEPGGFGHVARVLQWVSPGRAFQGPNDYPPNLGIACLAGRSRSRFVIEALQTSLEKSRPPFAHHAQQDPIFRATVLLLSPSAQASTTRARRASACCELDGLATGAARVHLRSNSQPAWVAQFASKPLIA